MKKALWAIGLLLVLVVGYVAAGPYLTVWAIKTAIVEQDSEKLSENIEFSTLRQNLKDQLNAEMMKSVVTELKGNPFAALAAAFVPEIVDGFVDSFVTPSGLAALMEGKKPSKNENEGNTAPPKKDSLFKNARYSYDSTSKCSIWVPDDKGKEARFVLQRNGLSWKLINIVIPIIDEKKLAESKVAINQVVRLQDVHYRRINNYILGQVGIVEGTAVNRADYPVSRILIKGEIVDAYSVVLNERTGYAGNILTDEELTNLSEEEILTKLAQPQGLNNSNDKIMPNGQIPFMIVFPNEPAGVTKTTVVTVGAERLLYN